MALINCPECDNKISDEAKRCPNCGYKTRKKKDIILKHKYTILIISSIVVILIVVLANVCSSISTPKNVRSEIYKDAKTSLKIADNYIDKNFSLTKANEKRVTKMNEKYYLFYNLGQDRISNEYTEEELAFADIIRKTIFFSGFDIKYPDSEFKDANDEQLIEYRNDLAELLGKPER